jgi:phospholipid transport system substrate-binding protein
MMASITATLMVLTMASPMGMLKRSNEEVRQLLRQEKGGIASPEQKQKIKRIVNGFLDYEELGKRSLATHWETLSSAQRGEFVGIFRELIERNYVKQLRTNVDYVIDYKDEEVSDKEAIVHSIIKAERKGRKAETQVDYKLTTKEGKWAVYDVITDDVSLLRNYRSQFGKIIDRDGFPTLLSKMKKRLSETTD